MELPDQWAAYARQQTELSRSSSLNDRCWGLETALDKLLDSAANDIQPPTDELKRNISTGARRNRHRNRLMVLNGHLLAETGTRSDNAAEARLALHAIAGSIDKFDFLLLLATAYGIKANTIAEHLIMSPSAVRQRISRVRRANMRLIE